MSGGGGVPAGVALRVGGGGGAVSPSKAPPGRGNYDHHRRRRTVRNGRERGCWVYIPAAELRKAGYLPSESVPWYRVWGGIRGGIRLRLYREGGKP
jgi:hypothetical protein